MGWRGHSLVEMVLALGLVGVLAAVAIPGSPGGSPALTAAQGRNRSIWCATTCGRRRS